jgi:hypothetical protein
VGAVAGGGCGRAQFQGVEQDDLCRTQQLLTFDGKCGHPCRNFTWGNAASLQVSTL